MTNEEAAVYLQFLRHTVPRYGLYDVALIKGIKALTKPVTDAKETVKCGRWIQVDETKCRCTNCDIIAQIALYPHGDNNFCPNCGTRMSKEDKQ